MPNQNYVKNILNQNISSEGREMIDWILYDSLLTTASTSQTLTFFQNTIGTVGRVRTNMKSAGALASPQSFAVIELGFRIINADGSSFFYAGGAAPSIHPINVMMAQAHFDFRLEPSTDYEGHGIEVWQQQDYLNDSGALLGVSGTPMLNYKPVKFKAPILIPPTRNFNVTLTLTTPAAAQGYVEATTKVYCYLKGLLRRNA